MGRRELEKSVVNDPSTTPHRDDLYNSHVHTHSVSSMGVSQYPRIPSRPHMYVDMCPSSHLSRGFTRYTTLDYPSYLSKTESLNLFRKDLLDGKSLPSSVYKPLSLFRHLLSEDPLTNNTTSVSRLRPLTVHLSLPTNLNLPVVTSGKSGLRLWSFRLPVMHGCRPRTRIMRGLVCGHLTVELQHPYH